MALPNPDLDILQEDSLAPLPEQVEEDQEQAEEEKKRLAEQAEDDLNRIIKDLIKKAEDEDNDLRFPLLRVCKRNNLYFNNIQTVFFDEVARDFRDISSVLQQLDKSLVNSDIKTVNIYRAYAESIIAALSVQPPNTQFMPDDAEDPEDLETAKAYSKIAELVGKHNHAGLMLIKALTLLYNCGVVFAHNYYREDPAFGTFKTAKVVKQVPKQVADLVCPQCNQLFDSNVPAQVAKETPLQCDGCGYTGPARLVPRLIYEEEVTGYEETPKGRSGFDIFGPTHVKAPLYARNQAGVGYLILRLEENIAKLKATYDRDDIVSGGGDLTLFERWSRIPPEYYGIFPKDLTTIRYCWFRPWYYRHIEDEENRELLESKYPNGLMVAIAGDIILEKRSASLDDEWTISFDPKSDFIHAEPPGNAVIPIQDAKNDVFNLGIQCIEFGIPETYVHPKTLNLSKYSEEKATPGMLTQAMPPGPGEKIQDGFYTNKPATLSNEYTNFDTKLDQMGQFVSAALPSLWGGTTKNGDTTASEYAQSRSQALQRIQIMWEMVTVFWSNLIFKCVKDYADNLRQDEKFTKQENGTYVNVWILKSSLEGKVGHVEPELSGSLPQSWAQKKDFFMKLIEMQSPEIGQILLHPNNSELIKRSTGMQDLYIPGENDRNKQFQEYYELCQGQPISETEPSVPIDIDVDDHIVHMQVLKNKLVSSEGIHLYKTNPMAYQNSILHYRAHQLALQAKTMAPSGTTGVNEPAESSANTTQG